MKFVYVYSVIEQRGTEIRTCVEVFPSFEKAWSEAICTYDGSFPLEFGDFTEKEFKKWAGKEFSLVNDGLRTVTAKVKENRLINHIEYSSSWGKTNPRSPDSITITIHKSEIDNDYPDCFEDLLTD